MLEYASGKKVEHRMMACSVGSGMLSGGLADVSGSPSRRTFTTPSSRSAGRPTAQASEHATRSSAKMMAPLRSRRERLASASDAKEGSEGEERDILACD